MLAAKDNTSPLHDKDRYWSWAHFHNQASSHHYPKTVASIILINNNFICIIERRSSHGNRVTISTTINDIVRSRTVIIYHQRKQNRCLWHLTEENCGHSGVDEYIESYDENQNLVLSCAKTSVHKIKPGFMECKRMRSSKDIDVRTHVWGLRIHDDEVNCSASAFSPRDFMAAMPYASDAFFLWVPAKLINVAQFCSLILQKTCTRMHCKLLINAPFI